MTLMGRSRFLHSSYRCRSAVPAIHWSVVRHRVPNEPDGTDRKTRPDHFYSHLMAVFGLGERIAQIRTLCVASDSDVDKKHCLHTLTIMLFK